MKTIEVLEKARELIARPGGWAQGAYAIDMHGRPCSPRYSNSATCFCPLGAIEHVCDPFIEETVKDALRAVLPRRYSTVISYNDNRDCTQKKAVRLFDRAIARLRETEAHDGR